MSEGKIFLRERKDVEPKSKIPRFSVIAISGLDLDIRSPYIGRKEAEDIASSLNAEVVYLATETRESQQSL